MNIISTYREVGTYRTAAELSGTTHKTVKRLVERAEADGCCVTAARPPTRSMPRSILRRCGRWCATGRWVPEWWARRLSDTPTPSSTMLRGKALPHDPWKSRQ
jgi:hypothetical protein